MGRAGALTLLIAAAALASTVHVAEAAAPGRVSAQSRLVLGVVAVEARVGGDRVESSGTVVDADSGLVLTSAQAVWGATSLKLATGLGVLHGRIVARAACAGLALVETQPFVPGLVSLAAAAGAGAPPRPGALVTAYGRRPARPGAGLLSLRARVAGAPLRFDAPLVPEAAGGPVLDASGRLVGIAAAGGAIPWPAVQRRLAELRPGPRRVFVGWRRQYDCAERLDEVARAAHRAFQDRDARLTAPVAVTRVPGADEVEVQ